MLNVTKTFFPPLEEYVHYLERIWENKWLTNRGELVQELEYKLKEELHVKNVIVMNNGTIPLQIALKLLGKNGEVITTPFSYIATSSSIIWENCKPIFVDIHPEYFTIDEELIEKAITSSTTCILATHVFGNPCEVEKIENLANKYKLKVIYDAAHSFGVDYKGKSIFCYGDVSTCSFHATKLFHTAEGGAVFAKDYSLHNDFLHAHSFGHNGPLDYHGLGINGKISELQAAMGLANLPHLNSVLNSRKNIVDFYDLNLDFSKFRKMKIRENTKWNFSYYPLVFDSEKHLIIKLQELGKFNIFPRRYFYPSLNTLKFINGGNMPISEEISSRIICLPLSHDCNYLDLKLICDVLNS